MLPLDIALPFSSQIPLNQGQVEEWAMLLEEIEALEHLDTAAESRPNAQS